LSSTGASPGEEIKICNVIVAVPGLTVENWADAS
jgi:hypothetical protein